MRRLADSDIDATGREQKQFYRVGGIAALVLAVGYVVIFPLYAKVGAPPSGGEAWFRYLAGRTTVWWIILGLSVFTDSVRTSCAGSLSRIEDDKQKRCS
jgi:hypothetical protein